MTKAPHIYICVEVTQTGRSWSSDLMLDGKHLVGPNPHSILQEMLDAGAELVSTHFSRAFVVGEGTRTAHILWVRFPRTMEENVKVLN